jgi:uncharacterized protein (TIGR01370 family)
MNDLLKAKKIFRRLSIMLFALIIMMLFLCSCRTINMVDSAETVLNGSLNIKELEDTTNPEKQVAIVKENNEFGTTQEKKIETTISPGSRLLYVLQNAGIYELFAADFDVAVVDPDDSGMKGIEVDTLKRQDKEIIAYISIGEAEDYRSYWKSDWKPGNPVFLDQEN